MNWSVGILVMVAGIATVRVAYAFDEDVYGESGSPEFQEPAATPEQEIVLPPYPSGDQLIEVPLDIKDSPLTLFIDAGSLTVGEDRVVRYTAVMRSAAGAENVVYEGLRCDRRQYRRYAFGAEGVFRPVRDSQWRYIRKIRQDRYRTILHDEYFCPLPGRDKVQRIIKKLTGRSPHKTIHVFE